MQSESDMCPVCIIMYPSSHSCPCRTVTSPDRFLLIHTQDDTLNSIGRVTQWEHAEKTLLHLLQVKLKPRQPQEASASWCCFFLIVSALTERTQNGRQIDIKVRLIRQFNQEVPVPGATI